jgi:spore coat protein U-like protein
LLPYNIDTLAFGTFSATTEWGNPLAGATYGTVDVSSTGTGAAHTVSVFPYITAVPLTTVAGAYTDTVVATLTF